MSLLDFSRSWTVEVVSRWYSILQERYIPQPNPHYPHCTPFIREYFIIRSYPFAIIEYVREKLSLLRQFCRTCEPISPYNPTHPLYTHRKITHSDSTTDICWEGQKRWNCTGLPPRVAYNSYSAKRSSYSFFGSVFGINRWYSLKNPAENPPNILIIPRSYSECA